MFSKRLFVPIMLTGIFFLSGVNVSGQSDGKAYAVLFFSPTCPHCHQLIIEDLPPIREQFGDNLVVFMVDVSTDNGQMMAQSAYEYYNIPRENWVVPMMIVDEQVLIGGAQIPTKLPIITSTGLENGGIPIPMFPLMQVAYDSWLSQTQSTQALEANEPILDDSPIVETSSPISTIIQKDPIASMITLGILFGLLISGIGLFVMRRRGFPVFIPELMIIGVTALVFLLALTIILSDYTDMLVLVIIAITFMGMMLASALAVYGQRVLPAVAVLTVVGFTISLYMAHIELTANPAVCGLIGDCNAVQQSDYAFIMGIPIGVIGVLGYVLMFVISFIIRFVPERYRATFVTLLQGLVVGAVIFTIYLTFLEPFVIGAVCAWCLLSSLVILNLMWLVLPIIQTEDHNDVLYMMCQSI